MDRQIVVGGKVYMYVAQIFIAKIWVFDGFEAKFRTSIKHMQEDNALSPYGLKVLKPNGMDTTAYLTFQRSSDILRALKLIEGSWFGESNVLEEGKFLWARSFHFTNGKNVNGDINHTKSRKQSTRKKCYSRFKFVRLDVSLY